MEILDKLGGDDDLTLILPEDGKQTDGVSGGAGDTHMNCLPPCVLTENVEVNLNSESYALEDPYEKDTNTLQVSNECDSSLLSCKKRAKSVGSKPKKWSHHKNTLQTGLEEET
jgi:hypothetical protein